MEKEETRKYGWKAFTQEFEDWYEEYTNPLLPETKKKNIELLTKVDEFLDDGAWGEDMGRRALMRAGLEWED